MCPPEIFWFALKQAQGSRELRNFITRRCRMHAAKDPWCILLDKLPENAEILPQTIQMLNYHNCS